MGKTEFGSCGLYEHIADTDTGYGEYLGCLVFRLQCLGLMNALSIQTQGMGSILDGRVFAINVLRMLVNGRCMQHASKALTLRPREASIAPPHIK
jgi:hypothetical protein